MNSREAFGYVVRVDGSTITLNLRDHHRGHLASHREGISRVNETGGLFAVDGGTRLLVLRTRSLYFSEPREAHTVVQQANAHKEPLRHLEATVTGVLAWEQRCLMFIPDSLISPALGAEAFPLTEAELAAILGHCTSSNQLLTLGSESRGGTSLLVDLTALLGRHVSVLGATGQGKSCFTAAILQQLLRFPQPRIVVFDINGEYAPALTSHVQKGVLKHTELGGTAATMKIPYYALGRHGLSRLFLPSERTQRPALAFAIDNLRFVKSFDAFEAGLRTNKGGVLFDDCRPGNANEAKKAIDALRSGQAAAMDCWPHMGALSCLAAESHAISWNERNNQHERSAFHYSNIAPLVTRIRRHIEDELFTSVVEIEGGKVLSGDLDWQAAGTELIDEVFGSARSTWKLHIVNLRNVAHDLMPLVLGSLLELFAFELFRRGQGESYPTLLVLEEAHHYLRQLADQDEEKGTRQALAYERLAKEGRKFGLGLWISTQRPSEVSKTVLSQCSTWVVFRLSADSDLRAVEAATEWVDRHELRRIAGLPRQQAMILGASVAMPVRILAPTATPTPRSSDPDFSCWCNPIDTIDDSATAETSKVDGGPFSFPDDDDEDDMPF